MFLSDTWRQPNNNNKYNIKRKTTENRTHKINTYKQKANNRNMNANRSRLNPYK